jgi:adenylyl-sulfate kinase
MSGRENHKGNLGQHSTVGAAALTVGVCVPKAGATSQPGTETRRAHSPGLAIFLTGLPAAGKTSIARELGTRLASLGRCVTMLDGDELRSRVSPDLGFSRSDREANLRCASVIATEVVKHGGIVVCSFVAPYEQSRQEFRDSVQEHGKFVLVHVATPLNECERRDPKGLYRKARVGILARFTGISDLYEVPRHSDIAIDTTALTVTESADLVVRGLAAKGLLVGLWLTALLHVSATTISEQPKMGVASAFRRTERHDRLFQRVLQATAERRVSLSELARHIGVERHTIEKLVRSTTGQSFRQLQQVLLLERAKLLLDQGKPIKEVAFDLGFEHPQSFHRFVKKFSGTTPSCLRAS